MDGHLERARGRWGVASGLLACGLLLGCRATPTPAPPLAPLAGPPGLVLEHGHFAGTSLSGPSATRGASAIESDLSRLYDLEVAALYLRQAPEELRLLAPRALEPLVGRFELALSLRERVEVAAAPRLFEGGLLAEGVAAREVFEQLGAVGEAQVAELFHGVEVLGAGMGFELAGTLSERLEDNDNFLGEFPRRPPTPKAFRLAVHAVAGNDPLQPRADWSLALSDALPALGKRRVTPSEEGFRPGSAAPVTELLRPEPEPAVGTPLLVILPAPFDGGAGRSLALLVELRLAPTGPDAPGADSPSTAERRAALERALASIEARQAATAARVAGRSVGGFLERTVAETYRRLEQLLAQGADLRPALLFLAGALEAPLALDALLALEPNELADLTTVLLADRAADAAGDAAWSLDRASWQALLAGASPSLLGPSAETAPERSPGQIAGLQGVVLRHAGEVGRYPGLLGDLLVSSVDGADFVTRLAAENRVFLSDSDPAARVRAYDWLRLRGLAPGLYDPLANRPARRAALEADSASTRAAAGSAETSTAEELQP